MPLGQKSQLFSRHQPGGVFTVVDEANFTTGDIWFVDSGSATGADSVGAGRNPDVPFLTWDYAVSQCTANQGDYIILMPGHQEVVAGAAGLVLDIAGITCKGLGSGTDQPTVRITLDTADIDVDAANVTIENIHFIAAYQDVAVAIDVNATDFTLRGCRFSEEATDENALVWVEDALAAASDRLTIEDCHAIALDADNTHFVNFVGTGGGYIIRDNVLIGDWGTVCIGGAGVIINCAILDNRLYNVSATAEAAIHVADTATGIVMGNLCGGTAAQAQGIGATACALAENYYGDLGGDVSAILEPVNT